MQNTCHLVQGLEVMMERIKIVLAIAPLGALALAVTYLLGYWQAFDIFPLPYLSFPQILSYSAIPFFGIVLSMLFGYSCSKFETLIFSLNEEDLHREGNYRDLIVFIFLASGAFLLFYGIPAGWFNVTVGLLILVPNRLMRHDSIKNLVKGKERYVEYAWFVMLVLIFTWVYGRITARHIGFEVKPDAVCVISGQSESVWWVGSLGDQAFFLDKNRQINMIPISDINRVKWLKTYESTDRRNQ